MGLMNLYELWRKDKGVKYVKIYYFCNRRNDSGNEIIAIYKVNFHEISPEKCNLKQL